MRKYMETMLKVSSIDNETVQRDSIFVIVSS